MDDARGTGKDDKKIILAKSYKEQEVLESHDHPDPKGTWHIEEIYLMKPFN